MSSLVGQHVDFKVYIEGHLIPSQSVNLTLYDGRETLCYIYTTPHESIKRISPMSTVSIFYYDNNIATWCLFWEGLYYGWQFSRSPLSRQIVLNCADWTILYKKLTGNMLGTPQQFLNLNYQIYGSGSTSPIGMGGDSYKNNVIPTIAGLAQAMFQPRGSMDFMTIVDAIKNETGDLMSFGSIIQTVTEALMWLNPLLYYRYTKSGLAKKFVAVLDDNLKKFFASDVLFSALGGFMQSYFNGATNLETMIGTWEAKMFYGHCNLVAPPFVNFSEEIKSTVDPKFCESDQYKAMYQFLYTPRMFFNIPPACNVIFPEMMTSIAYDRNYLADATRVLCKTPQIITGAPTSVAYFCSELDEYKTPEQIMKDMAGLPLNMYIGSYSAEEYECYVNMEEREIRASQYMTLAKNTDTESKKEDLERERRLLGAVSQHEYACAKYERRSLTISGSFNPYFVLGYPCIAIDGQMAFMAKPMSVTHTLNAGGSATTSYMCRFAIDLDKYDLVDETPTSRHTKFPPLPGWLPSAYTPDNIDTTYASILGRNIYKDAALGGKLTPDLRGRVVTDAKGDASGITNKRANIAVLVDTIFSLDRSKPMGRYDKATDKAEFARNYVMRGVTTVKQYGEFYNTDLTSNDAPKLKFPKMELFKHIEDIALGVRPDTALIDEAKQKTMKPSEFIDDKVKTKEEGSVNITAGYHKYDKMDQIQTELFNTGFKG